MQFRSLICQIKELPLVALLLGASFIVSIYFLSQMYLFTMDDSFITFRYATHLATGHGLVFNVSEYPRSEGITSPLYALVLTPLVLMGIGLEYSAKVLGVVMVAVVGFLLYRIFFLLFANEMERKTVLIGAWMLVFMYVTNAFVLANAISGMETMMGVAAVTLFVYCVSRAVLREKSDLDKHRVLSICLGLSAFAMPLLRPELALFSVLFFLMSLFLFKKSRRVLLNAMVLFFVLSGAYFIWRMQYYGNVLPLPFYIKQASGTLLGLGDGILFVKAYFPFIILAFVMLPFIKRLPSLKLRIVFLIIAATSVQFAYYLTIRHIMGFGFRYFLPLVPFLFLFSVAGISYLVHTFLRERQQLLFIVVSFFVVLITIWNAIGVEIAKSSYIDIIAKGNANNVKNALAWKKANDNLVIAMNDCGIFPYFTGYRIVDLAGLNNREIALSNTSETKLREIKNNAPDGVILIAKNQDKLYGWEGLRINDVESLGYVNQGSVRLEKNYYYMLFTRQSDKMQHVVATLQQQGILKKVTNAKQSQ